MMGKGKDAKKSEKKKPLKTAKEKKLAKRFYSKPSIQTSTVTKLSESDDNYEELVLSIDCFYGELEPNLHYIAPGINSTQKKWYDYVSGTINVSYNLQTFEFGRSTTRLRTGEWRVRRWK